MLVGLLAEDFHKLGRRMDLSHMKGWIQEILVIFFNFGRLDVFVDIMREYGRDLGEKNSCSMYF